MYLPYHIVGRQLQHENTPTYLEKMIRSILFLFILVATGTAFSPLPKASVVRSSTTALNMADVVKAGDRIPSIVLQEGQADYGKPEAVNIADLLSYQLVGGVTAGDDLERDSE